MRMCNLIWARYCIISIMWLSLCAPVIHDWCYVTASNHHDIMEWKIFRVTDLFVPGIHRSPVNSFHKGLMFLWSCLNKRLSKQSQRRWFETTSRSLWRHYNVISEVRGFHLRAILLEIPNTSTHSMLLKFTHQNLTGHMDSLLISVDTI